MLSSRGSLAVIKNIALPTCTQLAMNKSERQFKTNEPVDPSHRQQRALNIGTAVRSLSEDIPGFLDKSHRLDYSIYRDNLIFEDRTHSLSLQGLGKYQMLVRFGQRMLRAFFMQTRLEITKMSLVENDSSLAVRWRFTGTRRIGMQWLLPWRASSNHQPTRIKVVEGYSYYVFDKVGKVKAHVVDQIEPPLQRWNTLKAWFWWISRVPDASFQHHCERNSSNFNPTSDE